MLGIVFDNPITHHMAKRGSVAIKIKGHFDAKYVYQDLAGW